MFSLTGLPSADLTVMGTSLRLAYKRHFPNGSEATRRAFRRRILTTAPALSPAAQPIEFFSVGILHVTPPPNRGKNKL
jgi:hypothetical protein